MDYVKKQICVFGVLNDHDYYTLGKYDPESDRYDVDADFMKSKEWLRYDYGRFYASKSFSDGEKKRRILWSWVCESDTATRCYRKRLVWPSGASGLVKMEDQLVQWPVKELEKLRTRKVHFKNKRLKGRSMIEISADVEITFRVSNLKHAEVLSAEVVDPQILCTQKNATTDGKFGPIGLLVLASKDLTEHTAVFFRVFIIANSFRVLMCADPSRFYHSIVESFGGEGLACITSRVYPVLAVGEQAHLYAFNNGTQSLSISSLSAWSMKKAQIV
uniref:Putative glycoside hydrolase, family 32 n=1 Tax=Helianthus annuus TaxID=4232 RepID=A0A1Y3BXV3_HELAN